MITMTLCFLIKENNNQIQEICLAMKKRGFGVGRWNGAGGKVKEGTGESIEAAAKREAKEEFGVDIQDLQKVSEVAFYFLGRDELNAFVYTYLVRDWQGEPKESEEMKPQWFKVKDIPYQSMWPGDVHWLPEVLEGKLIKAKIVFDPAQDDKVLDHKLEEVDSL